MNQMREDKAASSSGGAEPTPDVLIGKNLEDRYVIMAFSERDDFGSLYTGIDVRTKLTIGIRVASDKVQHRKLRDWLAQAVFSPGKDAILSVGHLDRNTFAVVLAGAALDYLKFKPTEDSDFEDDMDDISMDRKMAKEPALGNQEGFFDRLKRVLKADK